MTEQAKRAVPVPLEALINAFQNERPERQHYLDLENGDVFPITGPDDEDWPEVQAGLGTRFLPVPVSAGAELAEDMRAFAALMTQPELRAALLAAPDLAAFRAALLAHPVQRGQWLVFRDNRVLARVLSWMAAQGIESNAGCNCHHAGS